MATTMLSLRQLNRATLDRQMLLERSTLPWGDAVSRLVGLQAQQAMAPFVGLWSRVEGFRREALAEALQERQIVKATFLRATLHLCLESDYRNFRSTLQSMLSAASESINEGRAQGLDPEPLVEAARSFLAGGPRTFAEISKMLVELMPGVDPGAMRYAVRTHLPLVQVPTESEWSFPGNPRFIPADSWLTEAVGEGDRLKELLLRYLAAFGPASVSDFQTWSSVPLKERIDEFRAELKEYRDGRRELFDLPEAVIADADTPAPVRYLPEYDNLLLSHQRRTRVIADEHRSRVYLPGLRVRSTFLIDGFVAGAWKAEAKRSLATLVLEPFVPLSGAERLELEEEGGRLLRFVHPGASTHSVTFNAG